MSLSERRPLDSVSGCFRASAAIRTLTPAFCVRSYSCQVEACGDEGKDGDKISLIKGNWSANLNKLRYERLIPDIPGLSTGRGKEVYWSPPLSCATRRAELKPAEGDIHNETYK